MCIIIFTIASHFPRFPRTSNASEGILRSVRSGLSYISRMVRCSRRSDVVSSVHFDRRREHMFPQRRSSVERDFDHVEDLKDDVEDLEDDEELRRSHSRPCMGEPFTSTQFPPSTFGPSTSTFGDPSVTDIYYPEMVHPPPEPDLQYTFQDKAPSTWATPTCNQFVEPHTEPIIYK